MKSFLTILPIPFFLAACANSPYHETLTGPTAGLLIENRSNLQAYAYVFLGAEKCTDMKLLSPVTAGDLQEHKIAAGAPLTFMIATTGTSPGMIHNCFAPATFTPVSGRTYRAVYELKTDKCYLSVTESPDSASGGATLKNVDLIKRTYKVPLLASQGFCSE